MTPFVSHVVVPESAVTGTSSNVTDVLTPLTVTYDCSARSLVTGIVNTAVEPSPSNSVSLIKESTDTSTVLIVIMSRFAGAVLKVIVLAVMSKS